MIAFDLVCSNGHKFECWFKDSDSFEEQRAFGLIHCPVCNDHQVKKAISSFAIKKYSGRSEVKEEKKEEKIDSTQAYQALRVITEYVNKNFEDVGLDFTREALKIHFGESKKRNIKGTALPDEEKVLKDEGVPFLKIPLIKHLDN
jgi:hypothetical protein